MISMRRRTMAVVAALFFSVGAEDPAFTLAKRKIDGMNAVFTQKSSFITFSTQRFSARTWSIAFKGSEMYTQSGKGDIRNGAAKITLAPQGIGGTNPWKTGPTIFNVNSPWVATVMHNNADSQVIRYQSSVNRSGEGIAGLQAARTTTAYPWSTVMHNRFVLENTGKKVSAKCALWYIASFANPGKKGRFKAYFHKNPASRFGSRGFRPDISSWDPARKAQIKHNIKPGIIEISNNKPGKKAKIGADTDQDWTAMVDTERKIVVAHICASDHTKNHDAHRGSNLEIYWNGTMLELEWLSPTAALAPNASLTLDIWTGHGSGKGVVVYANTVGAALDERLSFRGGTVRGSYAVFYGGSAHVHFYQGDKRSKTMPFLVSPLTQFNPTAPAPAGTERVEIEIFDRDGHSRGLLDWFPHDKVSSPVRPGRKNGTIKEAGEDRALRNFVQWSAAGERLFPRVNYQKKQPFRLVFSRAIRRSLNGMP